MPPPLLVQGPSPGHGSLTASPSPWLRPHPTDLLLLHLPLIQPPPKSRPWRRTKPPHRPPRPGRDEESEEPGDSSASARGPSDRPQSPNSPKRSPTRQPWSPRNPIASQPQHRHAQTQHLWSGRLRCGSSQSSSARHTLALRTPNAPAGKPQKSGSAAGRRRLVVRATAPGNAAVACANGSPPSRPSKLRSATPSRLSQLPYKRRHRDRPPNHSRNTNRGSDSNCCSRPRPQRRSRPNTSGHLGPLPRRNDQPARQTQQRHSSPLRRTASTSWPS